MKTKKKAKPSKLLPRPNYTKPARESFTRPAARVKNRAKALHDGAKDPAAWRPEVLDG